MKTLKSILYTIILVSISSNAQITKGNWMVGGSGSLGYSKTESKGSNSTGTTINYNSDGIYEILLEPNIGYFIADRLAVGCKFNFKNYSYKFLDINSEGLYFSFGPYVRYYIFKDKNLINAFIEPSYYRFLNKAFGNSSGYALKSGMVVFFNSSVGFETSISYNKNSNENTNVTNVFIGFGFQIHLEKE